MIEDDILREIRATREAFAKAHNYDIRAMGAYLRELDARGDWPVVNLSARHLAEAEATRPGGDPATESTPEIVEALDPS